MSKVLTEKLKEALLALLPITAIVLILNFTFMPMPFAVRGLFLGGAALLVLGMTLFALGADQAMMPIGEHLGQYLSKSKKIGLIVISSFIMGALVTLAEPDLQILARQIPGVPTMTLIIAIAIGLGIFLVLAILRIVFLWNMKWIFIGAYVIVFILGIFVPSDYQAVSFDASGVTTGSVTTPFVLALGVGIAAVRGGKSTLFDSFGLVGIASIGPIYATMVLGFIFPAKESSMTVEGIAEIDTLGELAASFVKAFPHYMQEMAIAIAPLVAVFLVFQIFALRLPMTLLVRIGFGIIYTFFGLAIFLTGAGVGFMPAGTYLGEYVGQLEFTGIIVPVGGIIGYFLVKAEPAVHVLANSVEELTGGSIAKTKLIQAFSISVAAAVMLAMIRVLTGLSIWWIIAPGYALALGLSFFVPKLFTALAFDSGGVATGPMTVTFIMPLTMGACLATGGDIMQNAFGVVAIVAMMPLITVQIIGLIFNRKQHVTEAQEDAQYESLADSVEEREFIDWAQQLQASEVSDDFETKMDMEYVASPEWAEMVRNDSLRTTIAKDNRYIDFDELEEGIKLEAIDAVSPLVITTESNPQSTPLVIAGSDPQSLINNR
jgi:hypothetical protein